MENSLLLLNIDREKLHRILTVALQHPDGMSSELFDFADRLQRRLYHSTGNEGIMFSDNEIMGEVPLEATVEVEIGKVSAAIPASA
jgi:hypothetical protein